MTAVNAIPGVQTTGVGGGAPQNSMSSLGINDFIQLMTTQLRYQDPTQPQDSTQFVAQLAQFSTVSGVQQMNTSISSLLNQLKGSQALNATSLVGHSVLVKADNMTIGAGASVTGAIQAPTGASSLTLTISDATGQPVRHMSVPVGSGLSAFAWDGKDDAGNPVAAGKYAFSAAGGVGGKSVAASTYLGNRIGSVTIDPSSNDLQLNTESLGTVTLADVIKVY